MKSFILLLILGLSYTFASTPEEAQNILDKFKHEQDTITRLEAFSGNFVGLPYGVGGPLGEGKDARFDQDPLYRFDTFDCTTFVETVVSLTLSQTASEFEHHMDEIRYENGKIDYLTRNHFPSLQWIPNNVRNGLLREANDLVLPPSEQLEARAVINLPGWLSKIKLEEIRVPLATAAERALLLEELHAMANLYAPQVATLMYLPIKTLLARPELLKKIPHGTLVNFVRPNWDLTEATGTHMNVSHQGFIFKSGKSIFLRHASTTGKVQENDLLEYLKKFENHATMKGIHLMQMN